MAKVFFVFGPKNSFYLETPKANTHSNIPKEVFNATRTHRIHTVYSLAVDEGGEIYLSYRDTQGTSRSWTTDKLNQHYPILKKWLDGHDKSGVSVVFGGKREEYITWHTNGEVKWNNLPRSCERLFKKKEELKCAALGVDGTYVLLWKDGTINWKLRDKYDQLDDILYHVSSKEIEFVALSGYQSDQFFLALNTGKVAFSVCSSNKDRIESTLSKNGITLKELTSQRATAAARLPAGAKSRKFLKGTVQSINFGASLLSIGTLIAGVVAGISCTVM